MTCAETRQTCVQRGDNNVDRGNAHMPRTAVTCASAPHTLCITRMGMWARESPRQTGRYAESLSNVYRVVICGENGGDPSAQFGVSLGHGAERLIAIIPYTQRKEVPATRHFLVPCVPGSNQFRCRSDFWAGRQLVSTAVISRQRSGIPPRPYGWPLRAALQTVRPSPEGRSLTYASHGRSTAAARGQRYRAAPGCCAGGGT
jgi:hypothetical protein